MSSNRKHNAWQMLVIFLSVLVLCAGCGSVEPKTEETKEEAISEYCSGLEPEARQYFSGLVSQAAQVADAQISVDLRNAGTDFFQAQPMPLTDLLKNTSPILFIGISKDNGSFNEEEIQKILREAVKQEIAADLFFNYNDYYVYQVRPEGVTIDKVTGKDGGAMHEFLEYDLGE